MVKAGHMDAIDEIFAERRRRGEAVPCFVLEESLVKEPKAEEWPSLWEIAGGVLLGLMGVVSFTFLAAVL